MSRESAERFSRRLGFRSTPAPITIWDDAPEEFRHAILQVAQRDCELSPHELRDIVCGVLRKKPDANNWTAFPNVWNEVEGLVEKCAWYRVYDILEAIAEDLTDKPVLRKHRTYQADEVYETEVNDVMREYGIGWQLNDGIVEARGEEGYEEHLRLAEDSLDEARLRTAHNELQEAVQDLSRRPMPDTSGAIQHAMAALEAAARQSAGDDKPTLGKLVQKHPHLFPKPVADAVSKLWGYASETARHGREGNDPLREDAMLVVGFAATLANYLACKMQDPTDSER